MSFRPPLWASLLTAAAVALFATLAGWQAQRGQDKAFMIDRRGDFSESGLVEVRRGAELPQHGRRIRVTGHWQPGREVLLDNQTRGGRVGVHAWTPLRLGDAGPLLLVNRGWVEASPYREQLPDTGTLADGPVEISGLWRDLPRAGLAAAVGTCVAAPHWPQRLNYPSHEQLRCLYDEPLADGLLLMDPQLPGGLIREWADLGLPPERHYGYAVQWAALALTALVLYLVLNLKRT